MLSSYVLVSPRVEPKKNVMAKEALGDGVCRVDSREGALNPKGVSNPSLITRWANCTHTLHAATCHSGSRL